MLIHQLRWCGIRSDGSEDDSKLDYFGDLHLLAGFFFPLKSLKSDFQALRSDFQALRCELSDFSFPLELIAPLPNVYFP